MKAIMLSVRPDRVVKLLNGELLADVRKLFSKDFVGWVYIYCTNGDYLVLTTDQDEECRNYYYEHFAIYEKSKWSEKRVKLVFGKYYNGKVVARFWCDRVEEIIGCLDPLSGDYFVSNKKELISKSCLTEYELENYLDLFHMCVYTKVVGYAIPITKLEIFDRPKELEDFNKKIIKGGWDLGVDITHNRGIPLTKAPQNYCYIEVEE